MKILNQKPCQIIALLVYSLVLHAVSPLEGPSEAINRSYLEQKIIAMVANVATTVTEGLTHNNILYQQAFDKSWEQKFSLSDTYSAEQSSTILKNTIFFHRYTLQKNFPQYMLQGPFEKTEKSFFLGLSSSAYQFEGGIGEESSWHRFALKTGKSLPGRAIDFWNQYADIIKEMKEQLHINSFRLSISWERVFPSQDTINVEALARYGDIIWTLRKYDIEPLVVLHHYTVPAWFEDLGGFEKEENIHHFVKFARCMYSSLGHLVTYWSTFNAIEGYAFKGYYKFDGPPGLEKSLQKTTTVMLNMLKSHVEIYEAIKGNSLKGTTGMWQMVARGLFPVNEPQIGIQKNVLQIDIAHETTAHYLAAPATWFLCKKGEKIQNDGFYGFFGTGTFHVKDKLLGVDVDYTNNFAPYTLDWIGVNYYSNRKHHFLAQVPDTDINLTTLNENYRFYPQGLYRAVHEVNEKICKPVEEEINQLFHKLHPVHEILYRSVPIWITENGIAAINEEQRELFFRRTLQVITELIQEDLYIIGYTPWASHDNWEWGAPLGTKRYGMFHVDFTTANLTRTLKPSSHYFATFAQNLNTGLPAWRHKK